MKKRGGIYLGIIALALVVNAVPVPANAANLFVLANRSTLVKSSKPMGEVIVANPEIADVQAHGNYYLSVVGKRSGSTTVRLFDKERKLIQSYDVAVGYDLVAVRQALKNLMPNELIGVEMVGSNVALTGQVSNATAAERAVRIVSEFFKDQLPQDKVAALSGAGGSSAPTAETTTTSSGVINLLQIASGQQVMLRVRVGEMQREALKQFGIDMTAIPNPGATGIFFGTGSGIASLLTSTDASAVAVPPGQFSFDSSSIGRGILGGRYQPDGVGGKTVAGVLNALERDGLFRLLAEPNLVAISGEQAEFLAGGEIPIPVPQSSGGSSGNVTIEYKPFGVAVKFKPFVLTETRIRMEVSPEVSELDTANALRLNGFTVPALTTRRAKTTVELAPGESFMIAGLIKDQTRAGIDQLPGVKELPVLGALFRSTSFQRNETELVIAVTPYIVDPIKGSDVRLPTDNFAPASQMEMIFYGALGALGGDANRISQTPSVEGPIGFMMD